METRPVNKLIGFDKNPRKITDAAVDAVVESLKRHHQVKRIIISAVGHPFEQEVICCGHTTWKALKKFGATEAKVDVVEFNDEADFIHYNVVDNKSGEFSEWEFDMMANMFSHDEMMEMGFNDADLGLADFGEPDGGNIEDDEIPENVETICKAGDLWQLGEHRLLCGDSTKAEDVERLMDGKKADMVFTDPPYGAGFNIENDQPDEFEEVFRLSMDNASMFCTDVFLIACYYSCISEFIIKMRELGFNFNEKVVWVKNLFGQGKIFHRKHEDILFFSKGNHAKDFRNKHDDAIQFDSVRNFMGSKNANEACGHPTQKPVELIQYIMRPFLSMTKIVLDPFLGSGSTMIACEKTKLKCYGMEIDEHYCDVIIQRFQDHTGQKATKL